MESEVAVLMKKARELDTSTQKDEFISLLQQAIKLDPYAAEPYIFLGLFYFKENEWEKACENLSEGINLDCSVGNRISLAEQAYIALGKSYKKINDKEKSLLYFRTLIGLFPQSPITQKLAEQLYGKQNIDPIWMNYYIKGCEEYQNGNLEPAQEFLEKSENINPSFSWTLYRLGLIKEEMNELEFASIDFLRAIEEERHYLFCAALARACHKLDRKDEERKGLAETLALNQHYAANLLKTAEDEIQNDNPKYAKFLLDIIMTRLPGSAYSQDAQELLNSIMPPEEEKPKAKPAETVSAAAETVEPQPETAEAAAEEYEEMMVEIGDEELEEYYHDEAIHESDYEEPSYPAAETAEAGPQALYEESAVTDASLLEAPSGILSMEGKSMEMPAPASVSQEEIMESSGAAALLIRALGNLESKIGELTLSVPDLSFMEKAAQDAAAAAVRAAEKSFAEASERIIADALRRKQQILEEAVREKEEIIGSAREEVDRLKGEIVLAVKAIGHLRFEKEEAETAVPEEQAAETEENVQPQEAAQLPEETPETAPEEVQTAEEEKIGGNESDGGEPKQADSPPASDYCIEEEEETPASPAQKEAPDDGESAAQETHSSKDQLVALLQALPKDMPAEEAETASGEEAEKEAEPQEEEEGDEPETEESAEEESRDAETETEETESDRDSKQAKKPRRKSEAGEKRRKNKKRK